jgi:lysophospholipase L1-like esterase
MGKYKTFGSRFDRVHRNDLNANFAAVEADINAQKGRVDELIIGTPQPSEVVDSRGGFPVLGERLNDLSSSLAQKAKEADLVVERNRISNLVAVQATTDNAETADVRVGFEGLTYASAGDAVRKQITELANAVKKNDIALTFTNGQYINVSGGKSTSANFKYTQPIELKNGSTIYVLATGYLTEVAIISTSTQSGTSITPVVMSLDGTARKYKYTAIDDCYVILSGLASAPFTAYTIEKLTAYTEYNDTKTRLELLTKGTNYRGITPAITSGFYINASGGKSTHASYQYTAPIALSIGEKIIFKSQGESTVIAMISTCKVDGTGIVPVVMSLDATTREYEYVAQNKTYVILCGKPISFVIRAFTVPESIPKNKFTPYDVDYSILFNNVVCIGDSLTRGYYAEYPSGSRNRDFTYPLAISKMTRWMVTNKGASGATPSDWYALHGAENFSAFDCAIICLGRNGGLTSDADKTAYQNIITALKTANANMTIFICSLPPSDLTTATDITINTIIKSIADANSLPYLDIYNKSCMDAPAYRSDGTHFYTLGYLTLAQTILDNIKVHIAENTSVFMQFPVAKTTADYLG